MRSHQYALVTVVCLACGSATCLYSGTGPMDGRDAAIAGTWHPILARIADLLTLPLPTLGIADVRDAVLPFFLAAASAVLAFASIPKSPSPQASAGQVRWFAWCGAGVIVFSIASAALSSNPELSWGWVTRMVCGIAWAHLIGRHFTPEMRRKTVTLLLLTAAAALLVSFAHRADRGYAHLTWPIGPITLTATLAAVWAAVGLVSATADSFLVRRHETCPQSPSRAAAALGLATAAIAFAALYSTGRRAPAVALVATLVVCAAVVVLTRRPRPILRTSLAVGLSGVLVAGVAYVVGQATSPDRVRSGPLHVRLAYLSESARLIGEHPLTGIGPDQFVVAMTNRMAPRRAVSPQVFHGDIDPTAHDEWLQAAVEIGVPGALLYLALPIIAIVGALRRGGADASTWAMAAGLLVLCIAECAGITLRGPVVPVWYWTFIGLLLRSADRSASAAATDARTPAPSAAFDFARFRFRAACGMAAIACLCMGALDQFGAMRRVIQGDATPAARRMFRLYGEKAILDRYANADALLAMARSSHEADRLLAAASAWRGLWTLLPGYADTAAQYARSLMLAGNSDEARRVLEAALNEDHDPYDGEANMVYAALLSDPLERLHCVQRSLRNAAWNQNLRAIAGTALRAPGVVDAIMSGADDARRIARGNDDETALRGDRLELLRILAARRYATGEFDAAIADQRLVAERYLRLERSSHPYRRGHGAEYDAWYDLARMILDRRPEEWRAAFEAVREAERLAVLGIPHEAVRRADPSLGYLGGEVVPTQFPERLRPLWQLSSLLHVIAGEDRFLDLRVFAGLPPERWTPADLDFELYNLALQAHERLSSITMEHRPPHYDKLPAMAAHYLERIRGTPLYEKLIAE